MALFLVTAATQEPVSLAQAKTHLKLGEDTTEDELITGLIQAATEYVETFTRRALLTQTWDAKRDMFPTDADCPIELPKAPVASVTSVTYIDTAGASQTWSSSLYTTDLPSGPQARVGRIYPAYGESYPSTRAMRNAVTVRFVAGYGASGADVPATLRAALLEHVRAGYGRGSEDHDTILGWVNRQLWSFKSF